MTQPIKFNDPVLGKIDELLGGGLFRSETRLIGPEVISAIGSADGSEMRKILADLGSLKSIKPESIAVTPVLSLAAFGLLAMDDINTKLGRVIDVPTNAPKVALAYSDILLYAASYAGLIPHLVGVSAGQLAKGTGYQEAVEHIVRIIVNRQQYSIQSAHRDKTANLDNLIEEWRTGETRAERFKREAEAQERKFHEAAERRRKRQLAAGFNDEDIDEGLADHIN